jgi:hypothetical protein
MKEWVETARAVGVKGRVETALLRRCSHAGVGCSQDTGLPRGTRREGYHDGEKQGLPRELEGRDTMMERKEIKKRRGELLLRAVATWR